MFKKVVDRAEKNVGGIVELSWPIGAVVLVDAGKERSALREANRMGVPVVALVDTNTDPTMVDYVIPGNDDAIRSIKLFCDLVSKAYLEGSKKWEVTLKEQLTKKAEAPKEEAAPQQEKAAGPAVIKVTKRKLVAAGTAETVEIEQEVEAKLEEKANTEEPKADDKK